MVSATTICLASGASPAVLPASALTGFKNNLAEACPVVDVDVEDVDQMLAKEPMQWSVEQSRVYETPWSTSIYRHLYTPLLYVRALHRRLDTPLL